jgi:hypothetical protein
MYYTCTACGKQRTFVLPVSKKEGGQGSGRRGLALSTVCQRPRSFANSCKLGVLSTTVVVCKLLRLLTTALVCKLLSTWRVVNDRGRLQSLVRLSPRSSANPIRFSVACPALVRLSTTVVVCKLLSTWRFVKDRGRLQTLVRLSTTAVGSTTQQACTCIQRHRLWRARLYVMRP